MAKKDLSGMIDPTENSVIYDTNTNNALDSLVGNNEPKKMGRPRKENRIREKGVQQGLTADYTRATFILKVETLEDLKNYAYTERLAIKEAVENIISEYLEKYKKNNNLLERNQ